MSEEYLSWSEFKEWQRLDERRVFFTHLAAYVVFNILFIYLNLTRTPEIIWFVYPLSAWGCGVALHYIVAIGLFDYVHQKSREKVKANLKKT